MATFIEQPDGVHDSAQQYFSPTNRSELHARAATVVGLFYKFQTSIVISGELLAIGIFLFSSSTASLVLPMISTLVSRYPCR